MTNKKRKPIEKLVNTINKTCEHHVITNNGDYLIVGTFISLKVHIEKSGNIFQPFGKNVRMTIPVFLPVIINKTKIANASLIEQSNKTAIPPLHLNKRQLDWNEFELEVLLTEWIYENIQNINIPTDQ